MLADFLPSLRAIPERVPREAKQSRAAGSVKLDRRARFAVALRRRSRPRDDGRSGEGATKLTKSLRALGVSLVFFVSLLPSWLARSAEMPQRIVSLNLCTDQLLWRLADREQIASLSFLAADPSESIVAGEIDGVPINYGRAEEVRLIDPDLVIAGTYGARFAVQLLKQRGYRVVEIPPAMSLADIAPSIEAVGAAIGQPERASAMAARVRARLKSLAATKPQTDVTAILFQPRGFAAGAPSLAHDALTLAGARNLAAGSGFKDWVPLGVEGLLEMDPQLVLIDSSPNAPPSMSYEILHHRALAVFTQTHRLAKIDSNLLACGTEETLDVVAQIRAAIASSSSSRGGEAGVAIQAQMRRPGSLRPDDVRPRNDEKRVAK